MGRELGPGESPLLCLVPLTVVCLFVLSSTSPLVSCVRGGWGALGCLSCPQPCVPCSSWLCLSCALQGPLVWAAPASACQGGAVGGRKRGRAVTSHPSAVGSLNCSYGGVPALEFLYTSCFGVLSYICTYRGGTWGGSLGERGAAAGLGLGTVVLGVGTGAVRPPPPRQGSAPREGCHLWVPMGPGG